MAKEVNKRINIWINGQQVENNLKSIKAAIVKTSNELGRMTIGSDEYIAHSKKLKELNAIYKEHKNELNGVAKAQDDLAVKAGALGAAFLGAKSAVSGFVDSTREFVDAYATIDDALSGVMKTTGMTREEVERLNDSLGNIDTRTSREELLTIAQIGGRMGLAKDQIESFTIAVDKANVALGDSFSGGAEEISAVLGKISLAFKETRDGDVGESLSRIGSAINEVGSMANATEPNIAAFVQRVGSMPEAFRPSVQEAVALGAAFEESSINAEVASRAFGILMSKASTDTESFAKVMDRPVEEIRDLINSNPTQFFVEFAKSLNGMNATEIGETLKSVKLNADGVVKIVGAMSGSSERFAEILATSNSAFAENVSLTNEFNTVNNNAAAGLEKAKNAVMEAKAALGEELIPVITKVTELGAGGLKIAAQVAKFLMSHPKLVISLAAAYTTLYAIRNAQFIKDKAIAAFTATRTALLSTHKTAVLALSVAKNTLANNTTRAAAAQKLLKAEFASTPWGAVIAAVTAIGVGIVKLIKNGNKASEITKKIKTSVTEMTYKSVANIENLSRKWKMLGDTLEDKEKFIRDNKDAFEELGIAINSVDEAENLLIKNKDKFVQSLFDRAYAAAMMKQAEQIIADNAEYTMNYATQAKVLREQADKIQEELDKMSGEEFNTHAAFMEKAALMEEKLKYENLAKSYQKKVDEINKKGLELMKIADQYQESENKIKSSMGLSTNNGTNTDENNGNNGSSVNDGGNAAFEKFEKKLKDFRERQQRASLEDWAKTKQGILDSYQEMIDEANKLGKKDVANQLTNERDSAIAAAGEKYMKKLATVFDDFRKQAESLINSDGEQSELSKIIIGTEKEWDEKIDLLKTNISTITDIISDLPDGDENRSIAESTLSYMQTQLDDSELYKVKAVSDAIKEYTKSTDKFIEEEQRAAEMATKSSKEREIAAINERYDVEIERLQKIVDKRALANAADPELPSLIEKLDLVKKLKSEAIANAGRGGGSSNPLDRLFNFDWKTLKDNWREGLDVMAGALNEFANTAFDVFNSINKIQANNEQSEFDKYVEIQDAKRERLEADLEAGLISQESYNEQVAEMDAERSEREKQMKHEQFEREKRANIIAATIQGAVAAVTAFAQLGPIAGAVAAALMAVTTALNVATIASQPNPYARGGYIDGEQVAVMGEEGREWVASNRLLTDRRTAPVIASLEAYQRGDRSALGSLSVSRPDWGNVYQSSSRISSTFANNNDELLKEVKRMNRFLSDPKNRQAVISRKQQLEFDRMETEIKNLSRL